MAEETIELAAGHEWRFEVAANDRLVVKLIEGTAELFGTELALEQDYEFSDYRGAIYTWYGCKLEYNGQVSEYTSEETPMSVYANLHFGLESLREKKEPANVLIVGPESTGKSSLAKILASYAVKQDRRSIYINLDPRAPQLLPPGGLTASAISDILDIENGWGFSAVNGPTPLQPTQPLMYYYGYEKIKENPKFYLQSLELLAKSVYKRLERDEKAASSGLIVDTSAEYTDPKDEYMLVQKAVDEFKINVLAVIGDERLYSDMNRRLRAKNPALAILKLAKSGGVVPDADHVYSRQLQHKATQNYFYGTNRQILSPYTITIRLNELSVYQVLEDKLFDHGPSDPGDYIPDESTGVEYIKKVDPSSILTNCVLAMMNAQPTDSAAKIAESEVLGFVFVSEVDEKKKTMRILLPLPGKLPSRPFVFGEFRYNE